VAQQAAHPACHLCGAPDAVALDLALPTDGPWLCEWCARRWGWRGTEFVMALVGMPPPAPVVH